MIDREKIKSLYDIIPSNPIVDKGNEEDADDDYRAVDEITSKKASFQELTDRVNETIEGMGLDNKNFQKSEKTLEKKESSSDVIDSKLDKTVIKTDITLTKTSETMNNETPQTIQKSVENIIKPKVEIPTITDGPDLLIEGPESITDSEVDVLDMPVEETQVNTSPELPDSPLPAMVQDTQNIYNNQIKTGDWLLISPSSKFNRFYEKKAELINEISSEPVDFGTIRGELLVAHVNVDIELYDTKAIFAKMVEIQQWRERLQEFKIKINSQFFLWKRCVPMMQGVLARIEYDKPSTKYEGIIFEHMRDLEEYFAKIEAIRADIEAVDDTLSQGFECLSRQITINNMRETPSHYGQKVNNQEPFRNEIAQKEVEQVVQKKPVVVEKPKVVYASSSYDGLDTESNAPATPVVKGVRKKSWSDK